MADSDRFRVSKRPVPVRVRLSTGRQITAHLQCAEQAHGHHGRERVKDVLNAEDPVVPLWSEGPAACTLVNKRFIEMVELLEPDVVDPQEPDLSNHREVSVLMSSGTGIRGTLYISTPPGQSRTLDFLNRGERFFYLDTEHGMTIVHLEHVVTVSDLVQTPLSSLPPANVTPANS
jgi:hypothetical protein